MSTKKELTRLSRANRVRSKVNGSEKRPRLTVFRSLKYTHAQLIDDEKGVTFASASDIKSKKGTRTEKAKEVGLEIAKKATEKKIDTVTFDRKGYKYHGIVKAMAEGAREGGLKF